MNILKNFLLIFIFIAVSCTDKATGPVYNNDNNESNNEETIFYKTSSAKFTKANRFLEKFAENFINKLAKIKNAQYFYGMLNKQINNYNLSLENLLNNSVFTSKFMNNDFFKDSEFDNSAELFDWIKSTFPYGINIHFPLEKHKKMYHPGDELYLAIAPIGIEESAINDVLAFDLHGNKIVLNIDSPPEIPTLVIAPAERPVKNNNYVINKNQIVDPGGGGWVYTDPYYRLILKYMNLMDDHEPWIYEPAEIYFKVRYYYDDPNSWQITYTPWDDDEGVYANLSLSVFKSYDYGTDWIVEVWEDDTGLTLGDDKLIGPKTISTSDVMHIGNNDIYCEFDTAQY